MFWGGGKPERQEERLEAYRAYLINRFGNSRQTVGLAESGAGRGGERLTKEKEIIKEELIM